MRGVLVALALGIGLVAGLPQALAQDFEIERLDPAAGDPPAAAVTSGAYSAQFGDYSYRDARRRGGPFWLRLTALGDTTVDGPPGLVVEKGRHLALQVEGPTGVPLLPADTVAGFGGVQYALYALPHPLTRGDTLYLRVAPGSGLAAETLAVSVEPLDVQLAHASEHTRMIALAFGALLALASGALLIWLVLKDRLFMLYATLFALHALYIAYVSGEGFDWPLLSAAGPLSSYAWNVPAALSGAVACLFVREIADLRHFSRRVYRIFGWFAIAFTVLAFANFIPKVGLGSAVPAIGNLMFVVAAVFTLVVALMAWRRGNRSAGWFLVAWILLEAFTIATAISMLQTRSDESHFLMYYGLPLSMVAAAILIALGVADRLREQRVALSEAERHAQTDALTGVLNRRSLIERLDAACARARTRGLPIALLFIDLDHFKEINDTFGHPAGDACLAAIIPPIQAELRQSDVIGRYGGEEFVVILSSADAAAAQPIAQRIRERVAAVAVEGFGGPIRLTCSIGVATSDTLGVWGEHLIAHADAAVYAAKRAGRNRVQVASSLAA